MSRFLHQDDDDNDDAKAIAIPHVFFRKDPNYAFITIHGESTNYKVYLFCS